jgi:hypothetical protein
MAGRKGLSEQERDRQNRKDITGQADRTGRTGLASWNRQNWTGRTGQAESDRQNRTGKIGQAEQDRKNRTGRIGQAE